MAEMHSLQSDVQSSFQSGFPVRRRVLVVEDEETNREILGLMLEDQYDVLLAETGKEAMEIIQTHETLLSLILLDLHLPDMHGMDILRQIKANPEFSRIPVIVATSDRQAEVECLTVGAIDFISKPYPMQDVVCARVQRIIEMTEDRELISSTERDGLTGLFNKEYFYRYAQQYDMHDPDKDMDAMVLDINRFHLLNERYGKPYGDTVLKKTAAAIQHNLSSKGGIACRREGDSFMIYCPHQDDAVDLLESISRETDSRVRLRMGVYAKADRSIAIEQRFDRAKMAADTVRNSFSKVIGYYDKELHDSDMFADQLLEDFPRAIAEKQICVYYQPKMNIHPEKPVLRSAEALVRWKHPSLGMISPNVFIPLFESNGLIRQLDSYVWREVAAQMQIWKQEIGISVPVSVNVSRVDMFDGDLVEEMKALIKTYDLKPEELLLEITESAYTQDADKIISVVNRLREAGFCIEMDDFGAGYSSLNMISTLPVDALKLDMSFIRNAFKGRKNTKMLEFVFDMASSLEVLTIAEGVETAEQLMNLCAMGCDIVQGYYFSPPVPAEKFKAFLLEKKKNASETSDSTDREIRRRSGDSEIASYTYNALHDPKTGLYNQSAYEVFIRDADQEHIGLLIANIDGYDKIRVTKGANVADQVVERAADALRNAFRSVDYVCRLSHDEFVVIISRANSDLKQVILDKMERVNRLLSEDREPYTGVTLSAGVAFADRENPRGDLFHDADLALAYSKEHGHGQCVIF